MSLVTASDGRLRKHADYQRVYKGSRKHFSPSMTYFFAVRTASPGTAKPGTANQGTGPRVGLTAGRVLGRAVERNRIKRRMRAVVRANLALLTQDVDVILHPRRTVLTTEFSGLDREVSRIFSLVEKSAEKSNA